MKKATKAKNKNGKSKKRVERKNGTPEIIAEKEKKLQLE